MAEVRLEDIKPNSHKSKEAIKIAKSKPKVTPVINKDSIVTTKKPLSQRFAETFITEDISDIKQWLITDVVIPGVKNTILDMLSMMFFSGKTSTRYGRRSGNYYNRENVSYNSYYKSETTRQNSRGYNSPQISGNGKVDYQNIILRRREDAERIVDEMHQRIADFGAVSIGEMLDLMEITGNFNDMNWGWKDPREIGIRRVPNGFLIDVAEAHYLEP